MTKEQQVCTLDPAQVPMMSIVGTLTVMTTGPSEVIGR